MTRLAHDPRELFVPDTGYGMSEEQWIALGDKMGFNKPIPVQYLVWLGKILRGDFGTSIHQKLEVRDIIFSKMGATIQLAVGGWCFAILVGVPLGVVAASSRGTIWDYLSRGFALFRPQIAPHDALISNARATRIPPVGFETCLRGQCKTGTWEHLLGTDHVGRDVLSRIIVGSRISLIVATIALVVGLVVGTTVAW